MSFRLLFSRTATKTWPEIMCSAGEALWREGKENGFPLTICEEKEHHEEHKKVRESFI